MAVTALALVTTSRLPALCQLAAPAAHRHCPPPLPDFDPVSTFFGQSRTLFGRQDCVYDPARDVYPGPRGAALPHRGNSNQVCVRSHQAPTAPGRACLGRARRTDSREGRKLNRPFAEDYRKRVRADHETSA